MKHQVTIEKTWAAWIAPVVLVFTLSACNLAPAEGSGNGGTVAPQVTALGQESGTCRIIGVDSESVSLTGTDGSLSFNLEISDEILILDDDPDDDFIPAPEIEVASFALYDADGIAVTDAVFSASLQGLPPSSVTNLYVGGVENPASDTEYVILIPAGSVSCADGAVNSSEYEIEFTLIATQSTDSLPTGSAPMEPELAVLTVEGTETSACGLVDVFTLHDLAIEENLSYGDPTPRTYMDNLVFSQSAAGKKDVLLTSLDTSRIALYESGGAKVDSVIALDEFMTGLLAEGTPDLSLALVSDSLELGDFELVFDSGAFGCDNGSENVARYVISFSITDHFAWETPDDCEAGSSCSPEKVDL